MPPLLALSAIIAVAGWGGSTDPLIERIQGLYVQQAIELATVGDRLVRLTRMTRFERCRTRRPRAEELNEHSVEVLGLDVPGIGYVAGIVNAIEGCEAHAEDQAPDSRGR